MAVPGFTVRSPDGVDLAVWVDGDGPPIVLVHGSMADHTTLDPFLAVLARSFTTYAMDRRGFGASGDRTEYSIDLEFADVAAVVDAVARRAGGTVTLWGHSYGASCAMGGAARTQKVGHLVLYEPSLGLRYPEGSIDAIEAALATGDAEGAIEAVLRDVLDLTADEIEGFRSHPLWPTRVASAHTIPRECRVEHGWRYAPGQFSAIAAPVLFLVGSDSVPEVLRATDAAMAAIPGARRVTLAGHGHFAHKEAPELVTDLIRRFAG